MNKPTEVFLFGAGAVIDWNGPLTYQLTKLVRESGFSILNSDTKITEFIFHHLLENGYSEDEVNFETIINVIEELMIYYSEYNTEKKTPSLLRSFIKGDNNKILLNYSIKHEVRKHGYELQIPKESDNPYSKKSYHGENPDQFFFQQLLATLITVINAKIATYAGISSTRSIIKNFTKESVLFKNWIQDKKSIYRFYTLNYDRLFKILLQDYGIDCFEGFELGNNEKRADVLGILNNIDANIHYNLHGSIFWTVKPYDFHQLPNPEIIFNNNADFPINNELATLQIENGKPLLVTSIITGYQKAQKSMITPYRQMHSSFDRDCCNGNKITIVGYSFGDEHINECIKTALRFNDKLTIEIVSPDFISNNLEAKVHEKIFSNIEGSIINKTFVNENKISYFDGKIIVHTLKFKDFLYLD